ncbi:hypothetical protein E1293_21850 [Actinomadura darangshiensis]|uniref:Uncharacterized protein n=1 Tax=Actinomadura darangshiensis TaxID=705336 RepID=A0A4R5B4T8_9ACTN|nr:hypothetical protein [Actinomadura darangshiensis]TDD79993.1 hypothetical protein E1293_21850 [Actinomadura darangshiensis]
MGAQRHGNDEPIIPQPELTPSALRQAVAIVAPSRLDEFLDDLERAVAEAVDQGSIIPIRVFYVTWAEFVEIERHPETARRLHEAERAMASYDDEVRDRAVREISDIARAAGQAVAGE